MKVRLLSTVLMAFFLSGSLSAKASAQDVADESPEVLKKRIEQMQRRLTDWPQLNRYRDANTKVPPPAKSENRVVFMGDSITDGWKLDEYFPTKPYINR